MTLINLLIEGNLNFSSPFNKYEIFSLISFSPSCLLVNSFPNISSSSNFLLELNPYPLRFCDKRITKSLNLMQLYFWDRKKRLVEIREAAKISKFGSVNPISGSDFVREVSQAPSDVWVVVILYKEGYRPYPTPQMFLCSLHSVDIYSMVC